MDKLNKLLEEYPNGKGDLDSLKFLRVFIERLVEKDKINFNFVKRVGSGDFTYDTNYYNRCTCEDLEEYGDVDRVLMQLSISDEPLEFLISILK